MVCAAAFAGQRKDRMKIFLATAALLAATPVALLSAGAAHAQAPTPDAIAAATVLVDLQTPPGAAKAALDTQLREMRQGMAIRAMLSGNPAFRAEAAKNQPAFNSAMARMGAIQADAVGPIMVEMQRASRSIAIDTFARNFTAAELQQITAFYKSPVGSKLLARQGQMSQAISKQVQARFGPRMEAAQKSIAPKLQAELTKLAPPAK